MRRRQATIRVAPAHRPVSVAAFTADAGANRYSTPRPSIVAVGYPPVLAVGDAGQATTRVVTQAQYIMALESESFNFVDLLPRCVGDTGFYETMAAVQEGVPAAWSESDGSLVPAWTYSGGIFRSAAAAPLMTAAVDVSGLVTVNVADVELEFSLREPEELNAILATSGAIRIRNINSPSQINMRFDIDFRTLNPSMVRIRPDIPLGIFVRRLDGGAAATVTFAKYRQRVQSIGMA